jgi:hypothetical protein
MGRNYGDDAKFFCVRAQKHEDKQWTFRKAPGVLSLGEAGFTHFYAPPPLKKLIYNFQFNITLFLKHTST